MHPSLIFFMVKTLFQIKIFFQIKLNESRYNALYVISRSMKKLFLIDYVKISLFSIFFSIDFARWKSVGLQKNYTLKVFYILEKSPTWPTIKTCQLPGAWNKKKFTLKKLLYFPKDFLYFVMDADQAENFLYPPILLDDCRLSVE